MSQPPAEGGEAKIDLRTKSEWARFPAGPLRGVEGGKPRMDFKERVRKWRLYVQRVTLLRWADRVKLPLMLFV